MHDYFIAPCPYVQKRSIELSVAQWTFLQQMGPTLTLADIAEGLGKSVEMARHHCHMHQIKFVHTVPNQSRHPKGVVPKGLKPNTPGGVSPHTSPEGTVRIRRYGRPDQIYAQIKHKGKWVWHHRLNWEALHGPIPATHCLVCRSNDRTNADPSNWEMLSKSDVMRRQHRPEVWAKVSETQKGLWNIVQDLEARGLKHHSIRHSTAQARANGSLSPSHVKHRTAA